MCSNTFGILLIGGGGLTAGILISKNARNREEGPSDDDYSYVVPKSSSTSTSVSSSKSSSSSSRSSSSSSSIVSKTPKEVMIDICNNVFVRGARYKDDYPNDYNYEYITGTYSGFYASAAFGADYANESYLEALVEATANNLPSYLTAIDQPHAGTWEEGINGYFQNFVSQDDQVKVELGSYIYHGDDGDNAVCQIYVHFNI